MIILEEVSKSFEDVVAVSRLSAHIKENSITGFLGPNGAGKSTTLKMIMGEVKPSLGTVKIMGENPWNNATIKRKLGYVSEHEDLYLWMTGIQFVTSLARLCMPRERAKNAAKEALQLVNLNTKKKIGAYSKGMKQRVKLAAAIVHSPDLLLLDEPFQTLDPIGRKEMKDLIMDLRTEHGVTVLVSSHILYEIDQISTHMLLIHRGQTIAQGRPTDIVELIDQYPHTIVIKSDKQEDLQNLAKSLLDEKIVRTVSVNTPSELQIITENPSYFYQAVTSIVAKQNLKINHLEPQTDNVESIFEYLTN